MKVIHGGDIYRNSVDIDFSVNINPFGIPSEVETALHNVVARSTQYPDIASDDLKAALSKNLSVPKNRILFGNGASELFMAVVHSIRPKKTVIVIPSFYGYEYAAKASEGEIVFYETRQENNFGMDKGIYNVLTDDAELLFLANPNNPVGYLTDKAFLRELLTYCMDKNIYVVLDECFIEFCGNGLSLVDEMELYRNLIIVRAFTKIFSIPGVRLGYLICENEELLTKIIRQLPEWNISVFAQAAGLECTKQKEFIVKTVEYVKAEREFLENNLRLLGLSVFPSNANFLLIYRKDNLCEKLLEKGILIRDCKNFRGLSEGFFRIAVKNREDNEVLLKRMGEIMCIK